MRPELLKNALRSSRSHISLSLSLSLIPIEHWSIVEITNGGLVQSTRTADAASVFPRKTKGKLFSNPKSQVVCEWDGEAFIITAASLWDLECGYDLMEKKWDEDQAWLVERGGRGGGCPLVSGYNGWKVVFHAVHAQRSWRRRDDSAGRASKIPGIPNCNYPHLMPGLFRDSLSRAAVDWSISIHVLIAVASAGDNKWNPDEQTIDPILLFGKNTTPSICLRENGLLCLKHLIYRFINELSRLLSKSVSWEWEKVGTGTTIDAVWVRR